MRNLKIAIIQMEIIDGNKEVNLNKALDFLESIAAKPDLPDIVCFPELFTTGYDLKKVRDYAEEIPGMTTEMIKKISMGKFIVIGTILERKANGYYNTAFILGKNGDLIGLYRKTHLFSPMEEKEFLLPGESINVFSLNDLGGLKIGLAICYDLRFPEIFRLMAIDGADIIFIPSEFPEPKRKIWKTLLHARAIENQCYIIGINRVGKGKKFDFFGYSLITNGDILEHLENRMEIKVFSLDLDSLKPIRESIPLLSDRRTDLYKIIKKY
ncbi:MAG: nitrilase-related carbon-nitrogen hydrolase [Promethearchaeia archaeon]